MKIKLKKAESIDDWYSIVRAEHDGREWWEETSPRCRSFMMSERLSPEACIEGTAYEMREIAEAIKGKGYAEFRRCAAIRNEELEGYLFYSPRNSQFHTLISFEDAEEFSDQVLLELPCRG